jgi:hypothetical protein
MAYITTQEVRAIRNQLKEKFGQLGLKFSVRNSNRMEVIVSIKSGKTDFSDLWSKNKPGDYGFGYEQINQYHLHNYGKHADLFREIIAVIKAAPATVPDGREWFDDSDPQSDYFHTAFYISLNVGSWNKPYIQE